MPLWLDPPFAALFGSHYLWHRLVTGKYGPSAPEKLGWLPPRPPDDARPLWWLHAVSMGEAIAAEPLRRAFLDRHSDWDWRASVTTATGREVLEQRAGPGRVGYYPLDCSRCVRRALDAWPPALVTLMELEVWPNFLAETRRRGIPVAVANVRITERSERRLARFGRLTRPLLLEPIGLWLAQSAEYADRLTRLGVDPARVEVAGSLKFDAFPGNPDPVLRDAWRRRLGVARPGSGPLWLAGSTHPSEEAALLGVWRALRADFPDLRLYIAPRHPERWNEVAKLMAEYGPMARRGALADDDPGGVMAEGRFPLTLGDSLGELGGAYAAADAVFVGGTLVPRGGQNFLEAVGAGVPTLCGPSVFNFAEAAAVLDAADGWRRVKDAEALRGVLGAWFRNPAAARALASRGREALSARRGAAALMAEALSRLAAGAFQHSF